MAIKINGEISYEGCVLALRERNMYDDSDFLAMVWNEETQRTEWIEYATTRAYTYSNGAAIDATAENMRKAAYYMAQVVTYQKHKRQQAEAVFPAIGKLCVVVKGKHSGKRGTCVWKGVNQFKHRSYHRDRPLVGDMRVGLSVTVEDRTTTIYTDMPNGRVVGHESADLVDADVRMHPWQIEIPSGMYQHVMQAVQQIESNADELLEAIRDRE